MIRILIADDQASVRDGLKLIVSLDSDISVVAMAENGEQVVNLAYQRRPDLILMDLHLSRMNGIEATVQILHELPDTKIIMLSTDESEDLLMSSIDAGVSGYLLKDSSREYLVTVIHGTMEGSHYIDPQVAGHLLSRRSMNRPPPLPTWYAILSERERMVLKLVGQGLTNHRIAQLMHLSEGALRHYVTVILSKLEVTDRTQAAILAVKHGLD